MKTVLTTTFAVLTFVVVSVGSADHKRQERRGSPLRLVDTLHLQVRELADGIDDHYSHSEWPHHQMNRISRAVDSLERDLASGHLHRIHGRLHHMQLMLAGLDARVRRSVVVRDHAGARHVSVNVRDMQKTLDRLDRSLDPPGQVCTAAAPTEKQVVIRSRQLLR